MSTDERLLRLEQLELTRTLFAAYARAADAASVPLMSDLFLADAVLANRRGEFTGQDAIADYFATTWRENPSLKRHFIANLDLDWSGPGRVGATSYLCFLAGSPDTSALGWGQYDASVHVTDESARFRATADRHGHGDRPADLLAP